MQKIDIGQAHSIAHAPDGDYALEVGAGGTLDQPLKDALCGQDTAEFVLGEVHLFDARVIGLRLDPMLCSGDAPRWIATLRADPRVRD